ncbi:MAG TPA: long-chain-acyl-CoA synthetase [Stellaceae bacterium]|nr:long-chain-acyl-CoA synthetase [Stellaceae bacterium]
MAMIDRVKAARPTEGAAGSAAKAWQRALEMTAPIGRDPALTLPFVIDAVAERFGSLPALLSEMETFSYRDLAALSKCYASWALNHGVGKGDVVALMMLNCPQYLAIWLGIVRVGGVVALVNTNLVGAALRHSFETVSPKHIIVGGPLIDAVAAIQPDLAQDVRIWTHGADGHGFPRIESALAEPGELDDAAYSPPTLDDRALYIYTSGTTGLPKAAAVSHRRLMQWTRWFAGMMEIVPSDRMYCCLPMYHSIGGVVAIGAPLVAGASVFIRERFSASRFWDDVADRDCTLFQYIGELCRYLVAAPPHPREQAHRLRLACGNGLRRDVWEAFQSRFGIPQILEFYAATEGSFSLYNAEGKPGAIGRIPSYLAHRFPVALVKFDVDTGAPARGPDGFCVRCAPDEPGEAIGKIAAGVGRFEGYTDAEASAKKVLRNVFTEGDAWYRTGDLMRRDRAGFFYFVDRVGDTFRWKGENVSTGEVEEVIAACPGVAEVAVYGVAVPGAEGRAGMAAIVPGDGFDLAQLHRHLVDRLPDYARPVFLRLRDGIALTGTFKPQKQQLAAEGFDPAATSDALYCDDRRQGAYVSLDIELRLKIEAGKIRL